MSANVTLALETGEWETLAQPLAAFLERASDFRRIPHHAFKNRHHVVAGRLTQGRKQSLNLAHPAMLD